MQNYIEIIRMAVLFFPIIAFLITIPYILVQYHKYGSVYYYRTLIIYSFILYLIVAYFLVILPLPTKEEVALLTSPKWQLQPFSFIKDIVTKSPLQIADINTYIPTIKSQVFKQAFFNILLCLPFGTYIHYYFKCNFKKTVILTFCLSLFFELTQLTGLYYIYPRGYRLFDVDDLMLNTFGGIIGYFLGHILLKILPTRNEIDKKALNLGTKVSILKRVMSFILDFILFHIIYNITLVFSSYFIENCMFSKFLYITLFLVYYVMRPIIKK